MSRRDVAYYKFADALNWIRGIKTENEKEIEKTKIENYDKKSIFKFSGFSNSFFQKKDNTQQKPENQETTNTLQKPENQDTANTLQKPDNQETTNTLQKPDNQEIINAPPTLDNQETTNTLQKPDNQEQIDTNQKPENQKNIKKGTINEYDERRKKQYGDKI